MNVATPRTPVELSISASHGTVTLLRESCKKIASTPVDNIHEIASILQNMIVAYYQDVRRQALLAFLAAFVLEIVAVSFFFYSAYSAMSGGNITRTALATISGLLIQIMTGVVFYLYSEAARQFAGFHICLERTNDSCWRMPWSSIFLMPSGHRSDRS